MREHTERLIEVRQEISQKQKELNDLLNEQSDLWRKIDKEINENKARYRKMEGLSGFIQCDDYVDTLGLILKFDVNSNPSAHALSLIEEDTGLKFKTCIDSKYIFDLSK